MRSFLTAAADISSVDKRAYPRVPGPCFLNGRCVGGIEEAFEVFDPPIHNILVLDQQHTVPTIHSVDSALQSFLRHRMVIQNLFLL